MSGYRPSEDDVGLEHFTLWKPADFLACQRFLELSFLDFPGLHVCAEAWIGWIGLLSLSFAAVCSDHTPPDVISNAITSLLTFE